MNDFDISKLRYHKIIIMTDADVDGAHICYTASDIPLPVYAGTDQAGHMYILHSRLFIRLKKNKKVWYAYSDDELNVIHTEIGRDQNNKDPALQRSWRDGCRTALGDNHGSGKRILKQVIMDEEKSKSDVTFTTLMGDKGRAKK